MRFNVLATSWRIFAAATLWFLAALGSLVIAAESQRPNVLLIITDDQGYGDIGYHGNTMLKTPSLDLLARQSVRLTNFHVDPTCAESRAALMTGKYSCRVGVWHTIMGRSILRRDEKIMPQYFAEAGYKTGMFGKWHLGDNYPYRPHDRGFQEALYHGGGGVGQSPDAWGNDYFDDTYLRNGKPERQTGYCTDVWFGAATKFIEKHRDEPFFCYVATNAPHSPYNIDPQYAEPYLKQGVPQPMANFYGMIANIDENIGRLLGKLDEWNLAENTIVVFMTDNGTAAGVVGAGAGGAKKRAGGVSPPIGKKNEGERGRAGEGERWKGFNAGMRAQKGSQYEGGHRVPCFIRWPQDKSVSGDKEMDRLAAHFDVLPTLLDLCRLLPEGPSPFDGKSLLPLLHRTHDELWRRVLVVHSQRVEHPEKWRKSCVMDDNHRLIDGKELYFLPTDPGQTKDISAQYPDAVHAFRNFYEKWWADVSKRFDEYSDIPLGDPAAPVQQLCCHDWHPADDGYVPWNQSGQQGVSMDPLANGQWAVEIAADGNYDFTLRMRPEGTPYKLPPGKARVKIGDTEAAADIPANADSVTIRLALKKSGHVMLQTWLIEADGKSRGAYYVTVSGESG
ncbi:MAG TPA: arylsulfatase [Pirellulaceae bacterium]|nr:arylsulfatase [Pirellulaceae bacterium]